jgi:hypothetical protein
MPELPISGLTTIGTQGGSDYFPVVESASGITKKESRSQLIASLGFSSYLPLTGGTMTGDVVFPATKGISGSSASVVFPSSGVITISSSTTANLSASGGAVNIQTTTGNVLIGNTTGYVGVVNGASNILRFSNGNNGFGGTMIGDSYITGTSGLKASYIHGMYPMSGASSSATYINNYISSYHYQAYDLSGGIEGIRNIVRIDSNTVASVKLNNAVQWNAGTVTNWYNYTAELSSAGTVTNAYHLYLGNGALGGTNKWFLYNDDSNVNSYLKGNVTFPNKIIQSTGYASDKTLDSSGVAIPHTGTAVETTLATIAIPAGMMGVNSVLMVTYTASCTNDASNKNIRFKIGATNFSNVALTSSAGGVKTFRVWNRNAVNSQVFPASSSASGAGAIAPGTSSIDFSTSQSLLITAELADSTDTITLESYTVKIENPAI